MPAVAIPIPVSYFQYDQQGVVFNMWYFGWFDDAMTQFLGEIGYPYTALNPKAVVPTLAIGDEIVTDTTVIVSRIDREFEGPAARRHAGPRHSCKYRGLHGPAKVPEILLHADALRDVPGAGDLQRVRRRVVVRPDSPGRSSASSTRGAGWDRS